MNREDRIAQVGGPEQYARMNKEASDALNALTAVCDGHPVHAIVNGAMLLALGMMRADGADIEDALNIVRDAWDKKVVTNMAKEFKKAMVVE